MMRSRLSGLGNILATIDLSWLLMAVLSSLMVLTASSLRLQLLFKLSNVSFKITEIMRLILLGFFFNNFMPSTIGGDVMKLYFAKKRAGGVIKSIAVIAADRFLGGAALVFMAAVGFFFGRRIVTHWFVPWVIMGAALIVIIGVFFIYSMTVKNLIIIILEKFKQKNIIKHFSSLSEIFSQMRGSKLLFFAFLSSLFSWLCMGLGVYCMARSLSVVLPVALFLIIVPVISLVSCLPSINGLGIREGAFIYFFKGFMPSEQAFALSLLFLAHIILGSFYGGFLYLLSGGIKEQGEN